MLFCNENYRPEKQKQCFTTTDKRANHHFGLWMYKCLNKKTNLYFFEKEKKKKKTCVHFIIPNFRTSTFIVFFPYHRIQTC